MRFLVEPEIELTPNVFAFNLYKLNKEVGTKVDIIGTVSYCLIFLKIKILGK